MLKYAVSASSTLELEFKLQVELKVVRLANKAAEKINLFVFEKVFVDFALECQAEEEEPIDKRCVQNITQTGTE